MASRAKFCPKPACQEAKKERQRATRRAYKRRRKDQLAIEYAKEVLDRIKELEDVDFNKLGEKLRKKFPELHGQPDFHEGNTVFVLKLVNLRDSEGKIAPKYKLLKKEFNLGQEVNTWKDV